MANRFGVDGEGILGLDELYGMFKRMPEHEGPYLMSLALEGSSGPELFGIRSRT